MKPNDEVIFNNDKHLLFVKALGKGGTGEVKLFYDSEIDKYFAIKKFVPPIEYLDEYYARFKNEIKILVDVFHPNVVRCYTYYLYPEYKTGYLQMEYIQGDTIDEYLNRFPDAFDKLFVSAINAFEYLQSMAVLHRDIRPQNFLVSNNELKVIDFGFGKETTAESLTTECLILNWPVTANPEEIDNASGYDFSTEIYFLGSLFKRLLKSNKTIYSNVIEKMCKYSKTERYQNFGDIKFEMNNLLYSTIAFTNKQKEIYSSFADRLLDCLATTYNNLVFRSDEEIMSGLEKNVKINSLEKYVSNNANLLSCFIKSSYSYKKDESVSLEALNSFYLWISSESKERQSIVFSNIKNRISNVRNEPHIPSDDLPF